MLKYFTFSRNLATILLSSQKTCTVRPLSVSAIKFCEVKDKEAETNEDGAVTEIDEKRKHLDRTKVIPVESSIKYLKSSAYKETYGDSLVWEQYK